MDDGLREQIIDRVIREVLYRIKELEPKEVVPENAVVLVTSFIPSFPKVDAILSDRYGSDVTYIDFCGYEFPSPMENVVNAEEVGKDRILELVNGAASVVLMAPQLKLLESISRGDDEGFVEFLTIRSLLWGRRVSVIMDFEPPAFKRNTFFEKVSDIIDVIKGIGIEVVTYDCKYEPPAALALVTESDVVEVWKSGRKEIRTAAGCIITPSARDKAGELGVKIN